MATKCSHCIRFRCFCCIPFSCFSSDDEERQDHPTASDDEEGQDHPASAGRRSLPSATVNTIETLPGAPKSIEAPIPGSSQSQSQSPMKYEIEDVDHVNLNVSGTHQCDKVPVSESLNILRKSEGKYVNVNLNVPGAPRCNEGSSSRSSNVPMKYEGEDVDVNLKVSGATHCDIEAPSSGSTDATGDCADCAETLPGAPKSTEAPIPGSSNVITPMKNEIEDVDHVNLNVSGTHQHDKAPVSESLNSQGKSEGKNGTVDLNVLGAPQCNEASSSGSSNVPMKHEGEDVDANLKVSGATHCDEAPSSGSPNVPVDANLNVLGAPSCNEAPSSSSSSSRVATTSSSSTGLIHTILHKDIEDDNIDELMKHISDLLNLREKEMRQHDQRLSNPSSFPWPAVRGLNKLKAILSWGTDLEKLKELLSSGLEFVSELKDNISGPITTVLKDIGKASVATAGLLVVAYTLERFDDLSNNKETCWALIKEMTCVGTVVKRLEQSSKGTQENVIEKATALVVEGAIMCCTQIGRSAWKSFFRASKDKDDLSDMRQKLNVMYNQINIEIGLRALTECERILAAIAPRNSPVSKEYPEHAVGIEESIEEVMKLLECESKKKVVTVILHGFGGIGKTTLADAVFSQVKGGKCSEVQLFSDIDSKPDIIQLQRKILKHLMEPGEVIPDIEKAEAGQQALGKILEKVEAFIYIDNVLDQVQLRRLLPQDLDKAKKVRFLLTARNKDVKLAFPSCTPTKIYPMEGIKNPEAALSILKKDISEGLDGSQFDKIIKICHGIPLMLKLVARFIGHADDKGTAYSEVMQEEEKWKNEGFNEMRLRFAYDALPEICKDPFLDICSYFKRWDWDTVENIVGKSELKMLESRALVTKDTFTGVVNVHDVILELGFHVSKGKEVRLSFTSARELKAYLEEEKEGAAEGIKGIWLTDNKDILQISALTLDFMHNSLRVLQLGKLTEVEGKCSKIFEKLVFFEAKVRQLPFLDVSKLKQLRYLSYAPNELKLSKMPSRLRQMEFDGSSSHSHAFQISSKDLQQHLDLRILRLLNFSELENLPEELVDQVEGLQELSLSNCKSIKKLPDSISKLPSLRILKMDNCSNLTELPVDFGSLSSLQELNLSGCEQLEALPESFDKLSSLKLLNLSNCERLLNLPQGLGKLTCLVELNIEYCKRLQSIPDSIGELKLLRFLDLKFCSTLKELPDGFCNLSSITTLSFRYCSSLEKLPDGFGQLKSLKVLHMTGCRRLQKLPEGFGQLKNLKRLYLERCSQLRELCNDFHCLSSLQQLDLAWCTTLEKLPENFHFLSSLQQLDLALCTTLEKLPENFHFLTSLRSLDLSDCKGLEKLPLYFHCLNSLQILSLADCPNLEGKSMDHVAKMNTLQVVVIEGSNELVKRWVEIQSDCPGSSYPSVISKEKRTIFKENVKKCVLSELDSLLTNGRGEPVHLSDLLPNTSTLLIFDDTEDEDKFAWPLIEEMVDDGMQIKIIYIGSHFDKLPAKVKDTIFVVHLSGIRTVEIFKSMWMTREGNDDVDDDDYDDNYDYVQIDAKMVGDGNSDNYGACWRFLTAAKLEEFVVSKCNRYLRLKKLAETNQESNIELLTTLFAPDGDETTPVFQKKESSQQDRTENSEPKTTCGVDKLKGKTVLVEMWPYNSWRLEINYHQFWKEVYIMEKKKVDLEIISIPIVYPSKECDVIDVYKQFSREVPWLVLQNSWTVITRAVKFFFEKHDGWEERDEREKWYPTINWIIEPNGRISVYRPSIFLKEEWEQPSTLEFLFNHTLLESVSAKVQKLMLPGKLICLYRGGDDDEQVLYSIWNALDQQQRDRIHIIHLGHRKMGSFQFTMNSKKDYYYPLKNTAEIEGMSSLNLSENEILRFSLRLCHLEKEINTMEDSELKFLLHSFQPLHSFQDEEDAQMYASIAFMDGGGKVVAALGGEILESIFYEEERAERFIKSIMNDIEGGGGGKEMHDEDPGVSDTLIQNRQTSSVEQQNVDAYFDSLREHISERLEVEFYHPFRFNKEGGKRSLPRVTWPTSKGFCRLKNFLSEGINDDWVKHVISGHPEEKNKRTIVVHSLLKGIEEALWAVAGLLAVADILERFETISSRRMDCLFLLDRMFRMAQNIQQFNQKPGLWRGVKRVATAIILASSIECCFQIDESKFAPFSEKDLEWAELILRKICDRMAEAITEGPSNESVSHLLKEMFYHFPGFRVFLRSGDEGGPSCEGESGMGGGSTAGTSGQEE